MKFFRSALTRQHVPIAVDFGVCVVFWGGCAECTECVCVFEDVCERACVCVCVCQRQTDRQPDTHRQTVSQTDTHTHLHTTRMLAHPLVFVFPFLVSILLFCLQNMPDHIRKREAERISATHANNVALMEAIKASQFPVTCVGGGIAVPCLF